MRLFECTADRADRALLRTDRAPAALVRENLGNRQSLALACGTALILHMCFIFVAEVAQRRENRIGSRLAESAERTHLDRFRRFFEESKRILVRVALRDIVEERKHLLGSFTAGNAFSAGFVLRETHEELRHSRHTGLLVHHDQAAGTDHRADTLQRVKIKRQVNHLLCEASAGRTADLDGLEVVRRDFAVIVRDAAADLVDDFAERGFRVHGTSPRLRG